MAKNWIKGDINPKHKGFCTPMSKKTCTPRRRALAMRFKKRGDLYSGKKMASGGLVIGGAPVRSLRYPNTREVS